MENSREIADRFKIRCSAIGKIMTNDRSGKKMGKTTESYCLDWLKEQPEFYNRKVEFSSKYTKKGNEVEQDSLDFVGKMEGYPFIIINDKSFSDNNFTGTPDNIQDTHIIDVKNSWTFETFPIFDTEVPSKDYWYQGQGYMHLCKKQKYKLIYCLMDTPEELIEREAYYVAKNMGLKEPTIEIFEDVKHRMTYPDVDDDKKIKIFEFDFEPEIIPTIVARVEECREFIYQKLITL